jgi:hypothetical protein
MDKAIYGLCTLTAAWCAWLLLRSYGRTRFRLLLWSGLCFVTLTLNNILLFVDKIIFPGPELDLSTWRLAAGLLAVLLLAGGLILESD